jgi:hypothetical protein
LTKNLDDNASKLFENARPDKLSRMTLKREATPAQDDRQERLRDTDRRKDDWQTDANTLALD